MFSKEAVEQLQKSEQQVKLFWRDGTDGKEPLFACVPQGFEIEGIETYLEQYLEKPKRRQGNMTATDSASLIGLVNRFKNGNSALFATSTVTANNINASLKAILNYNPAGTDMTAADWSDYTVGYGFPLSSELKVWLAQNLKPMNQREFAAFIEDNAGDMIVFDDSLCSVKFGEGLEPKMATPSDMFNLSRGIDIRAEEKITNVFRESDGTVNMQWTTEHKDSAGGKLAIPQWFALGVRIFQGEDNVVVPVKLRYRRNDGAIFWFYELYRLQDVFDNAFKGLCERVKSQTSCPLFFGQNS